MGREKCTGEIKNSLKISVENLEKKRQFVDLGLDEMLQCNELNVKDYNSSFLPLSKTQILSLIYKFC
jgi:hypothetical protein